MAAARAIDTACLCLWLVTDALQSMAHHIQVASRPALSQILRQCLDIDNDIIVHLHDKAARLSMPYNWQIDCILLSCSIMQVQAAPTLK